jgi:hypothetical protein
VPGFLFGEWRIADRAASAAERSLLRTSLAAIEGHGPPPSAVSVAVTAKLRHLADDLFYLAMAESAARAESLRRV